MESVNKIHGLVDAEIKAGLDESRVVVGGFSQGAAISLLVALTTDKKVRRERSWGRSRAYVALD